MIALLLGHLVFGTIWVGGGFYYNFILMPKLRRMQAGTEKAVNDAVTKTMGPLLGISALITILSGGVLLGLLRAEHEPNFITTTWGISMMVGLAASVLAVALVFAVEIPTGKKVDSVRAEVEGRTPTETQTHELERLSRRYASLGKLGTGLLFVALASMAVARFV